jgi:hypothetical protein
MTTELVKTDDGVMVKKTASMGVELGPVPEFDRGTLDIIESLTPEEERGYPGNALVGVRDNPAERKRMWNSIDRWVRDLLKARAKEQAHKAYGDAVRARHVDKPDAYPAPLRPAAAEPFKTYHLVSDSPRDVLLEPKHFVASIFDNVSMPESASDKIARGDRLKVYEPESLKLRFIARAESVNLLRRQVSAWDIEVDNEIAGPGE